MIRITIKKEDNIKVAGWLMDNGIEYSSTPTSPKEEQTPMRSKEEILEQAGIYAESQMPQGWDRNDMINLGEFYNHLVKNIFSQLPQFKDGKEAVEPFPNFYTRLKSFVSNVQVNDMMSEEEKEMILNVCDKFLNTQNK